MHIFFFFTQECRNLSLFLQNFQACSTQKGLLQQGFGGLPDVEKGSVIAFGKIWMYNFQIYLMFFNMISESFPKCWKSQGCQERSTYSEKRAERWKNECFWPFWGVKTTPIELKFGDHTFLLMGNQKIQTSPHEYSRRESAAQGLLRS